ENALHGLRIQRMSPQAIHRLGWECDQAACTQNVRGLSYAASVSRQQSSLPASGDAVHRPNDHTPGTRPSGTVTRASLPGVTVLRRRSFLVGSGSTTGRQATDQSLESVPCPWLRLPYRWLPRLDPTRRASILTWSGSACCLV